MYVFAVLKQLELIAFLKKRTYLYMYICKYVCVFVVWKRKLGWLVLLKRVYLYMYICKTV